MKYDMQQAIKERTVSNRVEFLPQELVEEFLNHCEYYNNLRNGNTPVFKGISDKHFKKHNKTCVVENDPFTLFEEQEITKSLDVSEFETISEKQKNYNVIYSNNKLNKLYNFYFPYNSILIIELIPVHLLKRLVPINSS